MGYHEWCNFSITLIETSNHFVKDPVTNMGDLQVIYVPQDSSLVALNLLVDDTFIIGVELLEALFNQVVSEILPEE